MTCTTCFQTPAGEDEFEQARATTPRRGCLRLAALLAILLSGGAQAQDASDCSFSGIWFRPAFAGEGFNVFQTPHGWLIYYLGYDNWGGPIWVTSDLVPADQVVFGAPIDLSMWYADESDASFLRPLPPQELEFWGNLRVQFFSCDSGRFELDSGEVWLFGYKRYDVMKAVGVTHPGG